MKTLTPFPFGSPTTAGELKVIAVGANDTLPAGTIKKDGLAYDPNGYLYVVII